MPIRIITDSASDCIYGERPDVTFLPMTVTFDETEYQDGVTLSHRAFYEKLIESDDLPTTSQIAPFAFSQAFAAAREAGEDVVCITLSGELSGTYHSAVTAAAEFDGVYVVDSKNATVGEKALVELALRLKDAGKEAADIAAELERERANVRLVALVDTLEYLQKGGRVSKAVAVAGGVLNIKPVIGVEGGKVVVLGKARGSKKANNVLCEYVEKAGGIDFEKPFFLGYSGLSDELIKKYVEDSRHLWEGRIERPGYASVGATIGTHVGPGAIAVAFFARRG